MKRILLSLMLVVASYQLSCGQITPAERDNTIQQLLQLLNDRYVFPDVAQKMGQHIQSKIRSYDKITDGEALATQLTTDLRAISHDLHLHVNYHPQGIPAEQLIKREPTPEEKVKQDAYIRKMLTRDNFGILDLSVLRGNIGYINFRLLAPPEFAGDSYIAAMNYLASTDALIIDLRQCGGSISPDAIPFLCTYFFEKPTHLNDLYWREGNITNQSWTYAHIPGKRYLNKPIYVLTSKRSFSGAEELAYDLKNLKRATLIGETTGGGANPGGTVRVNDHFTAWIPAGRAINPITKTNWEGIGVKPDTEVPASKALYTAQLMALKAMAAQTDVDADWRAELQKEISSLEKNPPSF